MNKLVIFTGGRSGSTALMNILNKVPEVSIFSEPFNVGLHNLTEDVNRPDYIERRLNSIFQKHTGIKHCWGQLSMDSTAALINILRSHNVKLLFLYRRNVLQSKVSLLLSQQSGIWHRNQISNDVRREIFDPIDIDFLRKKVEQENKLVPYYRSLIDGAHLASHELVYEELFGNSVPLDTKVSNLISAAKFLELEINAEFFYQKEISKWLGSEGKLSDRERYRKIPNLKDIMTLFGVDESLDVVG